ncbi:hypothetical protein, partial [Acetobacter cerevisiae]|uniref:hypothetical protein n=1 Tax=Acetobacter cerevisiae TaxID=178900 RepID=UPI0020A06E7D
LHGLPLSFQTQTRLPLALCADAKICDEAGLLDHWPVLYRYLQRWLSGDDTDQPEGSTTHNLESEGFPERMTGAYTA